MAPLKHGHARRSGWTQEFRAWVAMKNRCLNRAQARYGDYGGRGIKICRRWLIGTDDLGPFECFLADMGPKPSPEHSLDRKKVNQAYCPRNCRWATSKEQARNARSNHIIKIYGEKISFAEAVERYGAVAYGTALMRVWRSGWNPIAAIVTPIGQPQRGLTP